MITFLLWWIGIGFGSWFLKIFCYFRGPNNCVDWAIKIYKDKEEHEMVEMLERSRKWYPYATLIVNTVAGPLSFLGLIGVAGQVNQLLNKKN
jgi:hypothetical protein